MKKVYLGDSVYADYENEMVVLTTENGCGPTNKIYLELSVMDALFIYFSKIVEETDE